MSVSVFEHVALSGLFGDPEIQGLFSAKAQLGHMLAFERALAVALHAAGEIDTQAKEAACRAVDAFEPDWTGLNKGAARDGVVVPELARQLRSGVSLYDGIHAGATSQDVTDTATALTLRGVSEVFDARLASVLSRLQDLNARFGAREMIGRTRMQAAVPILAGHRIESWSAPLAQAHKQLQDVTSDIAILTLGGPVGDGRSFGASRDKIAAHMALALGLSTSGGVPQTDRRHLVSYGDWLSHLSGVLGKMGQDIALMAQQGLDEIVLTGGGQSSAMAHKQNPVLAELLVTLARFNAALVGALHSCLLHEQERSGAAWALEWMVLPQMVVATGRGLTAAQALLEQIVEIAP
ncbi:MAG: 3-carboxy-cis,cis-muconate cycloisomerase [Dinoroseobacter sp.]|nr:3-carboxy-cis,cis-muconate cycloisomerase [Dinoroseobacter sp.]